MRTRKMSRLLLMIVILLGVGISGIYIGCAETNVYAEEAEDEDEEQKTRGGLDKVPVIDSSHRSFIFIGDSYQVGAFCGKEEFSWLDYLLLAHENEMDAVYRNEVIGYGFAKKKIKYLNLIKEVDYIIADKTSITDVVTICGYNDHNCVSSLYDGMKNYVDHIRATYPNARIWIFPVEWTTDENLENVKKVHETVKKYADELGVIVCTEPEYVIYGDRISTDGIHPTVAGQIALGNAIADALKLSRNAHSDTAVNGLYTVEKLDKSRTTYYENGVRQWNLTGFCKKDDKLYYVVRGDVSTGSSGVLKGWNTETKCSEWRYVVNGVVDDSYTGFAENENGWWYIKNGQVDFNLTSVKKGTVKGQNDWWYVRGGKVQFIDTFGENENGWWYCDDGKVDFKLNSIKKGTVKGQNGWWYVRGGKVQFTDTFGENENGWWYCDDGKVDFNLTSVKKGTVKGQNGWWYVRGGKVQFTDTVAKNEYGWWYCKGGKVQFTDTVARNENGWWYCRGGKVDFNYTGLAKNEYGWWYCSKGKVDFNYTGIVRNQYGAWFCKGGKVRFDYSGTVNYNESEYIVNNGKVVE